MSDDVIVFDADPDACPRCSEMRNVCACPATTVMFREVDRNPGHVRITVWIGRNHGARGNAGTLTLRTDEWDELIAEPRTLGGILLLPVEVQP